MKYSLSAFKDQTILQVPKKMKNSFVTFIIDNFQYENTTHLAIIPKLLKIAQENGSENINNHEFHDTDDIFRQNLYKRIDINQLTNDYFSQFFKFTLDPFQKLSCLSVYRNENILVCAHTASGKTLVAEYAIHLALQQNKKVIYTSPIKALSNQKYHELSNIYKNVGLITGDTTLNPTADILVMTTEILRNMLYRQIPSNLFYIIFDEIHYMTDKERGVVWEECIILSPAPNIFLSATLENAEEFGAWVSAVQNKITHVVCNDRRVVPLIHYVFPVGGTGLYKIKGNASDSANNDFSQNKEIQDVNGLNSDLNNENDSSESQNSSSDRIRGGGEKIKRRVKKNKSEKKHKRNEKYISNHSINDKNSENHKFESQKINKHKSGKSSQDKEKIHGKITQKQQPKVENKKLREKSIKAFNALTQKSSDFNLEIFNEAIMQIKKSRLDHADIKNIIRLLTDKDLLPVIVFSFRRKDCENFATSLDDDFTSEEEKERIKLVFNNAVNTLNETDRNLTPIKSMLPLLLKGIGIHHSGLLAILKEIQEILFSMNLIKILFATETFSIGLNMPAKVVIFTTLFKFDGEKTRTVTSGEYIQMSGRAGRRGIDKEGIVISVLNEAINVETAIQIYNGRSNPIQSAFHLTYNMILNIINKENLSPQFVLERSFFHFQKMRSIDKLRKEVDDIFNMIEKVKNINISANQLNMNENMSKIEYNSNSVNLENTQDQIEDEKFKQYSKTIMNDENIPSNITNLNLKDILVKGRLLDVILKMNDFSLYLKHCIVGNTTINKNNDEMVIEIIIVLDKNKMKRKLIGIYDIVTIYDVRVKVSTKKYTKNFPLLFKTKETVNKNYCSFCEKELSNSCLEERCYTKLLHKYLKDKDGKKNLNLRNQFQNDDQFKYQNVSSLTIDHVKDPSIDIGVSESIIAEDTHESISKCSNSQYYYNENTKNKLIKYLTSLHATKSHLLFVQSKIDHIDQCQKMIQVLRRMNYYENNKITIKGRVACELNSSELVLTELIFSGNLIELGVVDMVSLLSCLVFEEKDGLNDMNCLSDESLKNYDLIEKEVMNIQKVCKQVGLPEDPLEYNYSNELMDVVKMWAIGHTFEEVTSRTTFFEGSIVRCLKRLEEMLRQLGSAARAIGNIEMEILFGEGISKIKRGVVFCNSLYL